MCRLSGVVIWNSSFCFERKKSRGDVIFSHLTCRRVEGMWTTPHLEQIMELNRLVHMERTKQLKSHHTKHCKISWTNYSFHIIILQLQGKKGIFCCFFSSFFCAASSSPCLRVPVDNTVKMSGFCPDLSPTCLGANPQRSNMLRQFVPQEKREAAAPTILAAEVIIVISQRLTLTWMSCSSSGWSLGINID